MVMKIEWGKWPKGLGATSVGVGVYDTRQPWQAQESYTLQLRIDHCQIRKIIIRLRPTCPHFGVCLCVCPFYCFNEHPSAIFLPPSPIS